MSAIKITDLLPIPPGTRQPHPYQVLGLDDGEQDPSKINGAIESIVIRLKGARQNTDPDVWKQAARLFKGAQEVLADPDKKAKLDARFGIVAIDSPEAFHQASDVDALAAFLPASDPLTAMPTSKDPRAAVLPPGLFGTPSADNDASSDASLLNPSPVVVKTPTRHRKRSIAGTLLFVIFAFGTFGVIGAFAYLLILAPGKVSITSHNGSITVSTQPQGGTSAAQIAKPRPVDRPKPSPPNDPNMGDPNMGDPNMGDPNMGDPIMGNLNTSASTDGAAGSPSGLTSSPHNMPLSPPGMSPESMAPSDAPSDGPTEQPPSKDADPESAKVTLPAMVPDREPLTDVMIASAEQGLERVRELIRAANWKQMKPAAEASLEQRSSESQQGEAQSLFELADLASYYRGGIERAVADLNVGNDFEVSDGVRVIVVETGPDLLIVRLNARNKSYTFDKLPLSLAHRLASFSMPDSPSTQAAKAVYQAIAPNTNDVYRDQALQWLGEIQGDVDGAVPERLIETIESLFVES